MEEGEADIAFGGDLMKEILSAVESPTGSEVAAVLGAVGIADHDDLFSILGLQVFGVDRTFEDVGQDGGCGLEVVDFFEEGGDAEGVFEGSG